MHVCLLVFPYVECGLHCVGIRAHMSEAIRDKYPASKLDMAIDTFPADDSTDPSAYLKGAVIITSE